MQTAMLIVFRCDNIDRKCRAFVWGDGQNVREIKHGKGLSLGFIGEIQIQLW